MAGIISGWFRLSSRRPRSSASSPAEAAQAIPCKPPLPQTVGQPASAPRVMSTARQPVKPQIIPMAMGWGELPRLAAVRRNPLPP